MNKDQPNLRNLVFCIICVVGNTISTGGFSNGTTISEFKCIKQKQHPCNNYDDMERILIEQTGYDRGYRLVYRIEEDQLVVPAFYRLDIAV